jgi:predicted amidohydrolase YtcJ
MRARHVEALRRMNALGLTGAHVMDGEPATHDLLRDLEESGELTMRLRVPQWLTPDMIDAELETRLALRDERGALWSGGTAKFFADGVIDAGTAWLEAPDTRGAGVTPFWPDPQRMAEVMTRFAAAGFQLATHTIGDAAARFTLETYLRNANGTRHRLEHLETLPDDLVAAIGASGVTASMQPVHTLAAKPEGNWSDRLGPERAARGFRMRDLVDAGAVLALGSDWPVGDADPRLGMATACARGLTDEEALAGYTTNAAYAVGDEAVAGRIRVGMRADLTGLPVDPAAPVWLTVVDGRGVHLTTPESARPAALAHA